MLVFKFGQNNLVKIWIRFLIVFLQVEEDTLIITFHFKNFMLWCTAFFQVILLRNHGFVVCGESIEDALHLAFHMIIACETQACWTLFHYTKEFTDFFWRAFRTINVTLEKLKKCNPVVMT